MNERGIMKGQLQGEPFGEKNAKRGELRNGCIYLLFGI